jgi:DNA primase
MSSGDTELIIPSIFISDDYKRHMSINLDTGLWQCFKSGNKGNFIQIYAFLEGITYNKAEADILFKELDGNFEKNLESTKQPAAAEPEELYLQSVTVEDYDSENALVQKAWAFLYERQLFNLETCDSKFYVSDRGKYKGRLIIPFEEDSEIFYFQARTLGDETPKYLNPSVGWPKPSQILYPFDETADFLLICEGPLDAISLQIHGINATCTMGCSVSEHQVETLKEFEGRIIIGYDNDDAGKRGVNKFDYLRRIKRMADLYICHPPSEVKDWNDAHMRGRDLREFVVKHTTKYDYDYLMNHLLTTL